MDDVQQLKIVLQDMGKDLIRKTDFTAYPNEVFFFNQRGRLLFSYEFDGVLWASQYDFYRRIPGFIKTRMSMEMAVSAVSGGFDGVSGCQLLSPGQTRKRKEFITQFISIIVNQKAIEKHFKSIGHE